MASMDASVSAIAILSPALSFWSPEYRLPTSALRMLTWIVCMAIQKLAMGFATEVRARRFLEARHKPLKLMKKEKISALALGLGFRAFRV